ncbi:MAG: D-glycero-beta-D-manno-heptose 1,7-bisphosphate 7-phosphatase [Proteobacteria bacterium]|nr:D-glycero-beta-D-manno-heptose 1,7-bisphosphate 7-phosphatase [Pseudomonadota bacterium]MDA0992334.1 D-glycero-beta-D-manno-heptose 1,7-bisphosphate 7-phosphatase [Pseudomonadota bacterium]
MSRRLVILDRDGVINHDSDDFIKSPAEWLPIDGSIEAISRLSAAGFDVAVATNQSGVGRKYIDRPTLEAIHDKMRRAVRDAGGDITRIVYCPHLPDAGCDCRKPKSGLYLQIGTYLGVPLEGVPMIGDSVRDIAAARSAGGRPILVLTGNGVAAAASLNESGVPVETFADLAAAVSFLIDEYRERSA